MTNIGFWGIWMPFENSLSEGKIYKCPICPFQVKYIDYDREFNYNKMDIILIHQNEHMIMHWAGLE